jgi:hypothetical protein
MLVRISRGRLMALGIFNWTAGGRPTATAAARDRERGAKMPVALRFGDLTGGIAEPFVETVEGVEGVILSGEDERLEMLDIVFVNSGEFLMMDEIRSIASSRTVDLVNKIFKDGCPLISKVIPSRRQKLRWKGFTDRSVVTGMRYLTSQGVNDLLQKQTKC